VDLELDVTGIAHGGVGVARDADGRVVFVADAIPGERVLAARTESKRSYARAVAIEVLEPSPHRVPHVWPEAGIDRAPEDRAGGAEFGHIALAHQRELKARVLAEALERFGGVDPRRLASLAHRSLSEAEGRVEGPVLSEAEGRVEGPVLSEAEGRVEGPVLEPVPGDDAANGLGWRTRVRLHVGEGGRPGPYAARSHRVVPVAAFPLAVPAIGASGVLGRDFAGAETVDVIAPRGGEVRLVDGRQRPTVIRERVGEREFAVDDTGFWQVHRAAPAVLTAALQSAVDPDRFDPAAPNLDLYGGVGLLAAALAELGGPGTRVTSVEADARASEHAAANLAEWPNAGAQPARVDRWVRDAARSGRRLDGATIVLDPPRSGAGEEVAAALTGLGPAQLVYVACDPVALARDARAIEARGYAMTRLRAFDLFPHTHHLEAVATFVRE